MSGAEAEKPVEPIDATKLILEGIKKLQAAEQGPAEEPEAEALPEDDSGDEAWDFTDPSLAALKRDGMSESMIRRLGLEDAQSLGKKRAKVQKDYAKAFGAKSGEDGERAYQAPDIKEAAKPLLSTLALDDSESDGFVKDLATAVNAIVEQRMARLESALVPMLQREEAAAWQHARKELVERIPGLADDETFEEAIKPRALRLAKAGEAEGLTGHARVLALIESAAKLQFDDIPSKAEVERRKKLSDLRRTSGNVSKRTPAHKDITDPQKRIEEGIRLLKLGKTREEIKAILG